MRVIGSLLDQAEAGKSFKVPDDFLTSLSLLLEQAGRKDADKALMARMLSLPDPQTIGLSRTKTYPQAIHAVREALLGAFSDRWHDDIQALYLANRTDGAFKNDFPARSQRALKNALLRLLSKGKDGANDLAKTQYDAANNMTDRVGALCVLADGSGHDREDAFTDFHTRFRSYPLVVDKWFSLQAMAVRPSTVDDVARLRGHKDFTLLNPNRVRALYAAFSMNNPVCFHDRSGKGYQFLCDAVIELNKTNPMIAARLLTPMRDWARYEPDLSAQMQAALQRVAQTQSLSSDVYEVVEKTLKAA
jgi:aminopeptidase N